MRYTDRLVDAGIAPSVGSQGDAYDNALAESVIGLYKTEVIRRKGPWRTLEAVEFATLTWVDWFNTRRLLGALVHESELARNDPHPEAPHLPISHDSGPPRSVIRFRMLHASSASALCPPGVRARRPVPMIDLYLKKAFSTRACRW